MTPHLVLEGTPKEFDFPDFRTNCEVECE